MHYLNNAGCCLRSAHTSNVLRRYLDREARVGQPRIEREWGDAFAALPRRLAALAGVQPQRLAWSTTTSAAFAAGFGALPVRGRRVLAAPGEWASNLAATARMHDVRVETLAIRNDGALDLDAIAGQIDDDVAAILCPMVSSVGGRCHDVAGLGALSRPDGCWFVVDAAQALARLPVDADAMRADLLVATTRKWLRGPRGLALMAFSERASAALGRTMSPDLAGIAVDAGSRDIRDREGARRFDRNDVSILGRVELVAALDELDALTLAGVRDRLDALRDAVVEHARAAGIETLLPAPATSIVTLRMSRDEALAGVTVAGAAGYVVKHCNPLDEPLEVSLRDETGLVRVSPHLHNDESEIATVVELLAKGRAPVAISLPGGTNPRSLSATQREALASAIDADVDSGELAGLHAVLLSHRGETVLERYYAGVDESWGMPLGQVDFGPDTLHDMRSISKSVVSLLYGIALADGAVPPPEAPLYGALPEYAHLGRGDGRERIRVEHALTMTLGLAWDETLSYADPRNSERAMEAAPDRCGYVLSQPVETAPGAQWRYSGGASALIAKLVEQGTQRPLLDYARDVLFAPLGIDEVEWIAGNDGHAAAASGLRLRPLDLLRLGEVLLADGYRGSKQIVPPEWLARATRPHVPAEDGLWYGYFFWTGHLRRPGDTWYASFGNGGQRLMLMPSFDAALAVTAGRYNDPEHWRVPARIALEHVLPTLRSS